MAERSDLSDDKNIDISNQNDLNNSIAIGRKISIKSNKSTHSLKNDKNIQSKDQAIKFKGNFKSGFLLSNFHINCQKFPIIRKFQIKIYSLVSHRVCENWN